MPKFLGTYGLKLVFERLLPGRKTFFLRAVINIFLFRRTPVDLPTGWPQRRRTERRRHQAGLAPSHAQPPPGHRELKEVPGEVAEGQENYGR